MQFQKYRDVFSEQALQRLPQHQPWDHVIDLKPDTTMKKKGIYHLTPVELNALKDYIEDHVTNEVRRESIPCLPILSHAL